MVFNFGYRKIADHKMVVSINPEIADESGDLRAKMIGELFRRLNMEIPFEFETLLFNIRKIKGGSIEGYYCVKKIIQFKISSQDAEQQLKLKNFKPNIPRCHGEKNDE